MKNLRRALPARLAWEPYLRIWTPECPGWGQDLKLDLLSAFWGLLLLFLPAWPSDQTVLSRPSFTAGSSLRGCDDTPLHLVSELLVPFVALTSLTPYLLALTLVLLHARACYIHCLSAGQAPLKRWSQRIDCRRYDVQLRKMPCSGGNDRGADVTFAAWRSSAKMFTVDRPAITCCVLYSSVALTECRG